MPTLKKAFVDSLLPRYLEKVLRRKRCKKFHPDELAHCVTREIRRDTGTDLRVTSRSVGTYIQHHHGELGFLKRIPDSEGDRYLYSYRHRGD